MQKKKFTRQTDLSVSAFSICNIYQRRPAPPPNIAAQQRTQYLNSISVKVCPRVRCTARINNAVLRSAAKNENKHDKHLL